MRLQGYVWILLFCISCADNERDFNYPVIDNVQKVETHFDISYVNDFVNLEKFKDSSVIEWFHKQDRIADKYFDSNTAFTKYLDHINEYAGSVANEAYDIKYDERQSTYYFRDTLSVSMIFRRNTQTGVEELLFNPTEYSKKDLEITYYKPSYDGEHIAIAVSTDSEFFQSIILVNSQSKKVVSRVEAQVKPNMVGGIVWTPDNSSILFIGYPNNTDEKKTNNSFLARYEIGQIGDIPSSILKDGDYGIPVFEEFYVIPKVRSEHDSYIFIYVANANEYWDCYYTTYAEFDSKNFNWKKLFGEVDQTLNDYGTERNHQYYYKRIKDGNIQLCQLDLNSPDTTVKILFEGKEEEQLSNFKVTENAIYYSVSKNGIEENLFKINSLGKTIPIDLPKLPGEIVFEYRSPYSNDLWLQLSGWTMNYESFRVLPNDSIVKENFPLRNTYPEFNGIISEVLEVASYDGTMVPVSIIRQKDFRRDGKNKAIVSAYGAYGISETPWFHEPILDFVNQGNIYVTAHVRGGGEKGPKWHEAGMMLNKPNSWKDLNQVSKLLIADGWVHPKKIGLNVNSAGAITAGMAVNAAPELYGALTIFNGAVNGIRTESIEGYDATDNAYEFGSTQDSLSFKSFVQLDPVVNFNSEVNYPSTLLFMGYEDYLIPPSGNGKYVALMQSANSSKNTPYLLDVGFDSEHEIDWYSDYAKAIFFIDTELDR